MNKEAIFTFIKKNIIALVCGVVAILAVVAIFYPIGAMVTDLQGEAETRGQAWTALSSLLKPRKLPVSDPFKTDTGDLKLQFPNPAAITAGKAANTQLADYSTQMYKELSDLNRAGHNLLVPDELPNPQSESTQFYFPRLYKLVLSTDPTITAVGDPTAVPPIPRDDALANARALNLQNDILHGALPPSPQEIEAAKASLWQNNYEIRIITANGKEMNKQQLLDQWTAESITLPQRLKLASARKFKMYVEKEAFSINPTILPEVKTPLPDIWYAQMAIWIQQDLCKALAEANANSKNVLDAPVKRLILMHVDPAPMYTFPPPVAGAVPQPGAPTNGPSPLTDTNAIPPLYAISQSGRYSNAMYDVVPFKLVIDVDASKVNDVIETLSRSGRLITVNGLNSFAINADAESAKGYLYGDGAAVRLQLDCEILFLRTWTLPLMPERVKMALGLQTPTAGGGTPGVPRPAMP